MKPYAAYKDSGVEWLGEIPEAWFLGRVRNAVKSRITDGPHETPEFADEGVPFLSVDAIQNGELVFEGCRHISVADHERFSRKAKPEFSDILLGKAASTGKIARVKTHVDFNVWSPLAILKPNLDVAHPPWLELALKAHSSQAQIDVLCTNNTQKNISMADIPRIFLAFPALPEQRAIAAYLDRETAQIDELIGEQEALIASLTERRQSVITHAVTKGLDPAVEMKDSGIDWLGEVPSSWHVSQLKHLGEVVLGKMLQSEPRSVEDVELEYLRAANVQPNGVLVPENLKTMWFRRAESDSLTLRTGDVVVVEGGVGGFGRAAFIDRDLPRCGFQNSINRIRPTTGSDGRYIAHLLVALRNSGWIRGYCNGVSMPHLTAEKLEAMPFPRPPKTVQEAIADYLSEQTSKIDELIVECRELIALLKERRSALISAAVTGKIDVRDEVLVDG